MTAKMKFGPSVARAFVTNRCQNCEWNVNVQFGFYSHPNFASKSSVDWTSPNVTRNLPSV